MGCVISIKIEGQFGIWISILILTLYFRLHTQKGCWVHNRREKQNPKNSLSWVFVKVHRDAQFHLIWCSIYLCSSICFVFQTDFCRCCSSRKKWRRIGKFMHLRRSLSTTRPKIAGSSSAERLNLVLFFFICSFDWFDFSFFRICVLYRLWNCYFPGILNRFVL